MRRLESWLERHECGFITAWRTYYNDVTDKTFKPKYESGEVYRNGWSENNELNEPPVNGEKFTRSEKDKYNGELKSVLLLRGFGVTSTKGVFREAGSEFDTAMEDSFFVVNLNNNPDFKKILFCLSEYYNQDCFMYSPKGSKVGYNIGTNHAGYPGYGKEVMVGDFHKYVQAVNMSRIGNKGFAFGEDADMKPDNPKTFRERKANRIQRNYDRQMNGIFESYKNHDNSYMQGLYVKYKNVYRRVENMLKEHNENLSAVNEKVQMLNAERFPRGIAINEMARINMKENDRCIFPYNKWEIKIWSNDHTPPHFHIIADGWNVSFRIDDGKLLKIESEGSKDSVYEYMTHNVKEWLESPSAILPQITNRQNATAQWEQIHDN